MWKRLPQLLVRVVLVELWLVLVVNPLPLYDAGPHVRNGWGENIRIRRLYTARKHGQESYYLRIHDDGRVDGERHESSHSLLEIRSVAVGIVGIKGYQSSRYLCMAGEGTLYGTYNYSPEECSFKEEIIDGYNMYKSAKYGLAVSLSKDKQRQQSKGKGYPPLSHFLPMMPWEPLDIIQSLEKDDDGFHYDNGKKKIPNLDSMDPLGLIERLFHKK